MSDTPKRRGPVPQYKPYLTRLTQEQIDLLHQQGARQGNQFIRDAIDFSQLYHKLFNDWRTTR